jgi:hypothetical protein
MMTVSGFNPYEPPASDVTPDMSLSRPRAFGSWAWEAAAGGLLIALYDVHSSSGDGTTISGAYLAAGVILGWRHARWAWLCWLPLGTSLYLAHLIAIAAGYKPPFVERDYDTALNTLIVLLPAGFGLLVGALTSEFRSFVFRQLGSVKHGDDT